jgi:putative transposase
VDGFKHARHVADLSLWYMSAGCRRRFRHNGPELIAQELADFDAPRTRSRCTISSRASPIRTPFIERFNRTYRNDVLDLYRFDDPEQAREITEACLS